MEAKMNRPVEVMEIAREARPEEKPLVIDRFEVSAETVDGARKAALAYRLRGTEGVSR